MKSMLKRLIAVLLTLCMIGSVLPLQLWAAEPEKQPVQQGEQPAALITPEGEVPADEDWDEAYPYGTFAFGSYQADLGEPGALTPEGEVLSQTVLLPVYRIGGTIGRVTARITYATAVTTDESGLAQVYDYAASGKSDLLIEVEDPNPLAAWQELGLPKAEREMQPEPKAVLHTETDSDGTLTLSLRDAEKAETFRWQYKGPAGGWKDVEGGADAVLTLTTDDYSALGITGWEGLDFRCVLTVDGALRCTVSMNGEVFAPYETPGVPPEGLTAPEEPRYTAVDFEGDYDIYEFPLTFAEGETVKYIRVTALDDELAELPELGLFTIVGCEGGELSDLCNTLTLMISDNDDAEPSELGLAFTGITVDRADGVAYATVRRTGGSTYNVTVDYETVDGTARAGVDYAAKSGSLAFVGSIDEIRIPIELISNEEIGEKTFSLKLSNLRGGGTDELCRLTDDTLTFTLTGASPKGKAGQNLATVLTGNDGTDASARVSVEDGALIPDSETQSVRVRMPDPEPVTAEFVPADESGTRSYSLTDKDHVFHFSRGSGYDDSYWHDWEIIVGNKLNGAGTVSDASSSGSYSGQWQFSVGNYNNHAIEWVDTEDGGTDSNGNATYFNHYFGKTSGDYASVLTPYMQIDGNYHGTASHHIPNAGDLFDQAVVITFLEKVGMKKRSGVSYCFNPVIALSASTPAGSVQNTTRLAWYDINFHPTDNTADFLRWMCTRGKDADQYWKFEYPLNPHTEDDVNLETWPAGGTVIPLTLTMGTDFDFYLAYEALDKDDNVVSDAWEMAQRSGSTVIDIPAYRLRRRVLSKTDDIGITVYTANDTNEGETAWTKLPDSFYTNLKSKLKLNLAAGAGGVTADGKLYAGSSFKVDTSSISGFRIAANGLFLTDGSGNRVGTVTLDANDPDVWTVTMPGVGMSEADLDKSYQINIVLERSQQIEIDVAPSIPRNGNAQPVFNAFVNDSTKLISVTRAALGLSNGIPTPSSTTGKYFSKTVVSLKNSDFSTDAYAVYKSPYLKNIQVVNFHQDKEDVILYNGKAYAGNADIKISVGDMTHETLHFTYYNKDFLDAVSQMAVFIDHVELYYDDDGDGIPGSYDEENELFVMSGNDELVSAKLSGDYPESTFKPRAAESKDNTVPPPQYYLKVFFRIRPRALRVPAGASEDDRAQVLPALASAITDDAAYAALTPEQQSYRYLRGFNADGLVMYGPEASNMNWVDIPLGGDVGSIEYYAETVAVKDKNGKIIGADTVEQYTWDPQYIGNLLVPFDAPTPVIDTDNITGGPVPMAGKEIPFDQSTKSFLYEEGDGSVDAMNAFLGAMVGRSTFVLGIQQQKKPLLSIKTLADIKPESVTVGTVSTTPNGDSLLNQSSGGDPGNSGGSSPGEDSGYPEFSADLGVELPNLELELGDYATLIMDGYQVGFAIGIPIYKYEDTNYSGSEKTETMSDGSTHTTGINQDGQHYEKTTQKDGTTTTVTTIPDPNDPKKRTVITETTGKDDKGKATWKKTTEEQEDLGGKTGWLCNGKTTTDTDPPAPSTAGEKFKKGFKEANGGMQTLADFIGACNTHNKEKLKDFFSGSFEDDSLKNAKNGNCTSTKVEVSFTVQLSLMFEFNPIDNCHYFKSAGISATLGVELSVQHRFSAFPLAYVYVKLGIEVELSLSLSCLRNPKLGKEIIDFRQGSLTGLAKEEPLVFELNMKKHKVTLDNGKTEEQKCRGFHINLLGSVYMEIFENAALSELLDAGALSGDGTEKEVLLKDYGKTVYIRLTPFHGPAIADSLRPVVGASSRVVFDGASITPSVSLEAGVGIGIELLKFEIFVKTSVAITLTIGGYTEETDDYEFYVSSFEWGLCVGFNVTALFFNYSMDAIGISVEGQQYGTGGIFSWDIKASAVNGDELLWNKTSFTAADGKPLGSQAPAPPADNNIGPLDTEFGYVFCGFPNGTSSAAPQPLTLTAEGFPEDCGWNLKENVKACDWWYGGAYKGEIPQDADLCVATRDGVTVDIPVPGGTKEILIYFDGKMDIQCSASGYSATGVKKTPVKIPVTEGGSVSAGDGSAVVRLTLTKGTKLDRWAVKKPAEDSSSAGASVNADASGLIQVSGPTDVSQTQGAVRFDANAARAIDPTGTDDFQLSGFNTAGDAKMLVYGLANGYSYKLFQAGGENYILYPYMLDGTAQLVLSKVVMTGNLNVITGLEHPTDPSAEEPRLKVDSDDLGDLDYNVSVSGDAVTVVWTAYADDSPAKSATAGAKNVVVKQASLTLGTDAAFSEPAILTEGMGSYRFLPARTGDTAVWAESSAENPNSVYTNNEQLAAYLLTITPDLTQEILDAGTTNNAVLASAVYRWVVQSDLNEIYGSSSVLAASNGARAVIPGENLENVELGTVGGKTVVLYSTAQTAYFDADLETPVTVWPEADPDTGELRFPKNTELATVRRLYLRELNGSAWGDALLLETVVDFDGCNDDNIESRSLKDGVYVGGSLKAAQADPYFGNLSFLRADLDGTGSPEALILFEMGGNSYLLRQADALSLLSGGEAAILPVFEKTTGTDVSIGSDGENLAVVYTAAIPGSPSNAIWTAWWDSNVGGWGSPTILAARHLQVYEDGIKYDIDPKEMEEIYLGLNGKTTPAGNTGSLTRLFFSDLQMSTRTVVRDDGTEGKQLLVMTMGSMQNLREYEIETKSGDKLLSAAPVGKAELKFYAIAFGVGDQALGEARLSLANYDFSQGTRLVGGLSFVNAGTAAIRASRDNPALVHLLVDEYEYYTDENGDPQRRVVWTQELAKWQLSESIRSGASVDLSFYSLELEKTLPAGCGFRLMVEEDPDYFGSNAFTAEVPDLLTVEERPELGILTFTAALDHIQGDKAYLKIHTIVNNSGNADANAVFLQFAYDTGEKDSDGRAVYLPVDITGSTLETSAQKPTNTRQAVEADEHNGVYKLYGPEEEGNTADRCILKKGYYRTVEGLLAVPTSCFISLEELSGLHLRVEAYSDFDSPDYNQGLYSSDHNEYNDTNNRAEQTLKHRTVFSVPGHIMTALGTTLNLPVQYQTTVGAPDIIVEEVSDGTEGWEPLMGICYYDPDRKVIVAAPNAKAQAMLEAGQIPTGILQVRDAATNSIAAIAYTVGAMADGVNIYRDDASFTFWEPDGSPTNVNAAISDDPGWAFRDWPSSTGWLCGSAGEIPMNYDLSVARKDNASVSFQTVADTLTIYYVGDIRVVSDHFGEGSFSSVISETTSRTEPAYIQFHNDSGQLHTVTIYAGEGTLLDRYSATYKTNPVPDADPDAPQILWNRNYPDTASLQPGQSLSMTCYILDLSGLQSVYFDGKLLSASTTPKLVQLDENLWCFDFSFTTNGVYNVRALDLTGKSSGGSVAVDWFNDVLSTGANAGAPGLVRSHLKFVKTNGAAVDTSQTLTSAPYLKSTYSPADGESSSAYLFQDGSFAGSPLGKVSDERWMAAWNGYYQVRVDRGDGTWARAIVPLTCLDLAEPADRLNLEGDGSPGVPYLINDRTDWKELQRWVDNGNRTIGLCFLQTADFTVNEEDMIGPKEGKAFEGVYDGGGHTLTFNVSNCETNNCAPFKFTREATFRNLRVAGSVTSTKKYVAGIAANANGSITIENCRSSIEIHSNIDSDNHDGTHGGFIAVCPGSCVTTMVGCVFDGKLYGSDTALSSAFIGCNKGTATLTDCFCAAQVFEWQNSHTFSRDIYDGVSELRNCYYTLGAGDDQGKEARAVLPGENVALEFEDVRTYDVAGLTACAPGLIRNGTFYAGYGETVSLAPSYTGDPADAELAFYADNVSDEDFCNSRGNIWTLTMPNADVTIRMAGHSWGEVRYSWSADYSTVTAIRVCLNNPVHREEETAQSEGTVILEPTCTEQGRTTYTASFTNPIFAAQTLTVPDIPALGHALIHHEGQLPTCTSLGWMAYDTCSRCDYSSYRELPALGHDLIGHEGQAPTCTEIGWAAYDTCSRCDYSTYEEIPALGHDLIHHEAQAPTCTEIGWEAYDSCSRCDYSTYEETPALGHDLIHHEAQEPTCTEIGWQAYDTCSRCDYSTYVEIPALGHDLIHHEAQEPTCTEIGWEAYDTCSRCDYSTYSEEAALGHIWGEAEYVWEEDFSSVTATARCTRDPEHELTETVAPVFYIVTPSTFETTGEGYYLAEFEDEHFETQRMDVEIPVVACEGGDACPSAHFTDMPPVTNYAHIPIDWAVVNHITEGTSPTTFSPNLTVNRAQVVTFLWAAAGKPEPSSEENPFTDVKPGKYYYKAVLWAVENGITSGVTPTTFGPKQVCNRAQVVTFLWAAKGKPEPAATENPFTDVSASAWYYKSVLWAYENGVTGGTGDGTTFSPKADCTRAQVVTFLYKAFGQAE